MRKVLAVFLFVTALAVGLYILQVTENDPEGTYGLIIAPIFTVMICIFAYGLLITKSRR